MDKGKQILSSIKQKILDNKKVLKNVIWAIVIGVLIEWIFCANIMEVFVNLYANDGRTLSIEEAAISNYSYTDGKLTSLDPNAYIEYNGISQNVRNIEIDLEKGLEHASKFQVYYGTEAEGYSEERTSVVYAGKGAKRITIGIGADVDKFMIVLGNETGLEFEVSRILVNQASFMKMLFPYNENSLVRIVIFASVIGFILLCVTYGYRKVLQRAYEHRFLIGGIIVAVCTVLKISGSSLGCYFAYLPGGDFGPAFGTARGIRTDEFAVFTPMAFSQGADKSGAYSYLGSIFRGTQTDMFAVYGQPVKNILMMYRPFQIGYLILGSEMGLAFYWSARLVCLFLSTFEFGMLISKKNKKLSLILALLLTFSPLVQWWYSVNALVEMLIFAQTAIVLINLYMNSEKRSVKWICGIVITICAGGFALAMYPAWEIPLAYVVVGMFIWVLLKNRKVFKIRKTDVAIVSTMILVLAGTLGYFFYKSYDTIQLVMNSAYPGDRCTTGGNIWNIESLVKSYGNIFFGLDSSAVALNTSEYSAVFDFFPIGIILAIGAMIRNKKKDNLSIILLIINAVFGLFICFQFSETLAKVSFLSRTTPERLVAVFGIVSLYLLIRAVAIREELKPSIVEDIIIAISFIAVIGLNFHYYAGYYTELKKIIVVVIVGFGIVFWRNFYQKHIGEWAVLGCLLIAFFGGMTVNPVQAGASELLDNVVVRKIKEVNDQQEGKWAVVDTCFPIRNIPAMVGASTINSTNTYPNLELWKQLDEDGTYEEIYNRYAHIQIEISDAEENTFRLIAPDSFAVTMSVDDLEKVGVDYIFSMYPLEDEDLNKLFEYEGFFIYEIE